MNLLQGKTHRAFRSTQLVAFLVLAAMLTGCAKPWPEPGFAEVRAFVWERGSLPVEQEWVIEWETMTPVPGARDPGGIVLTPEQVKRLCTAMTKFGGDYSKACYHPRHAFIFYDTEQRPVAVAEICFGCFQVREKPGRAARHPDWMALAELAEELGLDEGLRAGVTKMMEER